MLLPVCIPVQPSSQDCLAWSQDGELAVAAGEEVYLLIPKEGSSETWTQLRITVSYFITQEWPWQVPASFKNMSIGEEQARATVTALAWSPPGLAKHRRSILAVLILKARKESSLFTKLFPRDLANSKESALWHGLRQTLSILTVKHLFHGESGE